MAVSNTTSSGNTERSPRVAFVVALRQDVIAKTRVLYGEVSGRNVVRALASDGASAVILFRTSQLLAQLRLAPLAWLISKANKVLNGVTIGIRAQVSPGFVIQHSVGVVINGRVSIGQGCVLEGGVVIGSVERRSPRLASGVYVGSGAKIIGDVTVGADSKIGANAVVVRDVRPGATVVGIPAKEI